MTPHHCAMSWCLSSPGSQKQPPSVLILYLHPTQHLVRRKHRKHLSYDLIFQNCWKNDILLWSIAPSFSTNPSLWDQCSGCKTGRCEAHTRQTWYVDMEEFCIIDNTILNISSLYPCCQAENSRHLPTFTSLPIERFVIIFPLCSSLLSNLPSEKFNCQL